MEQKIVWQQGSGNPENPNHLATIREWWENLNGKEITWQQRIISQSGEVEELDWEPQRFDEVFAIARMTNPVSSTIPAPKFPHSPKSATTQTNVKPDPNRIPSAFSCQTVQQLLRKLNRT